MQHRNRSRPPFFAAERELDGRQFRPNAVPAAIQANSLTGKVRVQAEKKRASPSSGSRHSWPATLVNRHEDGGMATAFRGHARHGEASQNLRSGGRDSASFPTRTEPAQHARAKPWACHPPSSISVPTHLAFRLFINYKRRMTTL